MRTTMKHTLQSVTVVACLGMAAALHAGTHLTPVHGGTGGAPFTLDCGDDGILIGIHGRAGDWIDQIIPICVKVSVDGKWYGLPFTKGSTGAGGPANFRQKKCFHDEAVISIHGRNGWYVHQIDLKCVPIGPTPGAGHTLKVEGKKQGDFGFGWDTCPNSKKPARGFYGKSGLFIDSIGLRCHAGTTPLLYDPARPNIAPQPSH